MIASKATFFTIYSPSIVTFIPGYNTNMTLFWPINSGSDKQVESSLSKNVVKSRMLPMINPFGPVAQRYHVTSDTLGREFDPGKRDFSH